ncbi:MAG: sensor histidine kinase, partial [Bradyrhizobium sp.]
TLHWPAGDMRWSAQLYDILGLVPDDVSPSYRVLIERIHAGDRARFAEALAQAIENRGEFSCEARIACEPARHVQALGEVKPGAANSIELIGTIADVTERKQTEQALRDAEAELARTLRLATLAELAAAIAHEINQPLAAITANGSACVRSLAHQPPMLDNAREAASCIVSDGHRAADVIARIRALFNKEELDQQRLDLNAVIRHVLDLSRGAIARQHVVVHAEFATSPTQVMGDRVQLQQVLVNLVTNALEAMAGSVDRPQVLTVRSEVEADGGIHVTVEDTGRGLEPGQLPRIFDSFYTTKPDGIGVGLAISRSIIEAHGGTLWASAATPHGARIGFTLPAAGPASE